jgi:hypothetical protein
VQSRSGATNYKTVSLDRAARLTGEAFGYEDGSVGQHGAGSHSGNRMVWTLVALAALGGLAYLALR